MNTLSFVLRQPLLRALVAMGLLYGVVNACIFPYLSLVAVKEIGLGPTQVAMVLGLASGAAMAASVLFGILADRMGNRRVIALWTVAATVLATSMVAAWPSVPTLIIAQGLFFPIGTAIFGQLFALIALASDKQPDRRDAIQALARAGVSAAFLVTLLGWTWALGPLGLPVLSVYPAATLAALVLFALIWWSLPPKGAEPWTERPSGLALRPALAELMRPALAARLMAMGAMGGLPLLYIVLTPLLFAQSPARQTSDVALFVGLVAAFEVPFMLALPRLLGRFSRVGLILAGAGIYAGFVVLLVVMAGSQVALWALPALAGLGAAPLLTLPIGYWQDLMRGRPGTASALMALQKLFGDLTCAAVFALGSHWHGYEGAALLGALVAVAGGSCLWILDRRAQLCPSQG